MQEKLEKYIFFPFSANFGCLITLIGWTHLLIFSNLCLARAQNTLFLVTSNLCKWTITLHFSFMLLKSNNLTIYDKQYVKRNLNKGQKNWDAIIILLIFVTQSMAKVIWIKRQMVSKNTLASGHALWILICGCSLFYRREVWDE